MCSWGVAGFAFDFANCTLLDVVPPLLFAQERYPHTGLEEPYLGHEVHTPLALLLLKLERNTSHRTPLDTLHEVGHKASDLVPHPLGRDDRDFVAHALVRVEVHGQARVVLLDDGSRRLLHGLRADTLCEQSK